MDKKIKYNQVKEEFIKYFNTFDQNNEKNILKLNHSFAVSELMVDLAEKMNLDDEKISLARIIGLLHDIGRFEQIKQYDSYEDNEVLDHANYGVDYLFKQNNIRKFIKTDIYDEIIATSILYHNKKNIPHKLSSDEEMFCKMIRDCDKIDIYKQTATLEKDLFDKDKVNPKILWDFRNHSLIDNNDIKSDSDTIIRIMAFVFDINYKASYQLLVDKDNFGLYTSMVEINKESEDLFYELKQLCMDVMEGGF